MALTDLQKHVMRCLAANRSETSYVAGGVVLNRDWRSDLRDILTEKKNSREIPLHENLERLYS